MILAKLSQCNAITLDKKNWNNSKAKATRAAVKIKDTLCANDKEHLDNIAVDVQYHLNNGTLDEAKLNEIIIQLRIMGLKAKPAHEFLHNIIIVNQHSSARFKIHNWFGHTLKTDSLKSFLKSQAPQIKTSFYSWNSIETANIADALLLAKIARVYHDVAMYNRSNQCFDDFIKQDMPQEIRKEVEMLYSSNKANEIVISQPATPTPARKFLSLVSSMNKSTEEGK